MQAWTPVVVSDESHERFTHGGICQGVPFTLASATTDDAKRLADEWQAARDLANAAQLELQAAQQKADRMEAAALAALEAAGTAQAAAAGEQVDTRERVRVKFDLDGQVLELRVDQLQALA